MTFGSGVKKGKIIRMMPMTASMTWSHSKTVAQSIAVLLRPGTCTQFDIKDLDKNGIKIQWPQQIFEPDNHENIDERIKTWKKLHPEL